MEQSSLKKRIFEEGVKKLLDEAKVPMKVHLEVLKKLHDATIAHNKDIKRWDTIIESHKIAKGEPGDKGYTPLKDIDYFDGENGQNYILTENDKKEIAQTIKVPIVKQIVKHTETIREKPIVTEITKVIKESNINEDELMQKFIDYIKKNQVFDTTHIKGLQGFVKNGIAYKFEELMSGFGNASGGGFTQLAATETPNSSLTVFTFATATAKPSYLVVDNVWMKATTKAGTVNWTWNAGLTQATLSVPPQDDIWGVV